MSKLYVIILILLCVSCSLPSSPEENGIDVVMVDRLHLTPMGTDRGVYSVRLDTNALQTFFKLRAEIKHKSQKKIHWYSNDYWYIYFVNKFEQVAIINPASYMTDDGYSYNMGAVNIQLKNKIVTIYAYYWEGNGRYIDSVKIFVN